MAIGSTALANFLIILVIGIVAGLTFNRYARSWLARLGTTTRSDITASLVGIAGAFIGFHISIILGLLPSPLMHFILAAVRCLRGSMVVERTLNSWRWWPARSMTPQDITTARRHMTDGKLKAREVAATFGVGERSLWRNLRWAAELEEVRAGLASGALSLGAAREADGALKTWAQSGLL